MARRKSGSASPALTPRTPAAVARGCAGAKRAPRPQRLAAVGVPSLRRLARRAGVKRIAPSTYESTREALNAWLRIIVRDVCCIVENRRRITATLPDVLYALKRNGRTLYGWSGEGGACDARACDARAMRAMQSLGGGRHAQAGACRERRACAAVASC
jgi:histone H4